MPAIVMTMFVSPTPQTEGTMVECMSVKVSIIAVRKVYTIVSTTIAMITYRYTEIEVVAVRIVCIDTQAPGITCHIEGTVEVLTIDKTTVLATTKHVHEVFVAYIEQVIIVIYGIIVSVYNIIYHLIYLIEEVEVDLIYIIILTIAKAKFVTHTVGKETSLTTDIRQAHGCKTLCIDS